MRNNLKLLSFILLLLTQGAGAQTFIFNYTGGVQTWTVPVGVSSIAIDLLGASGGFSTYYSPGGCGGEVQCTLAVTPGQVLNIYVGGIGGDGSYFGPGGGGFNGGGNGGSSFFTGGGGGGGATDIRIGGIGLGARVAAAGGGAGAGDDYGGLETGGDGGGPGAAGDGLDYGFYSIFSCGGGATPTAGGAGSLGGGVTGVSLFGGDGSGFLFTDGGGGGGGYWGGGGGDAGGGGGGSSYTDPTIATAVTHTQGANCTSDGLATITVLCTTPTGGAIVGPSSICLGSTVTYTNPTGTAGGTWSIAPTLVATVNPTTGAVTALSSGPATLTYSISLSCGSASVSYPINVIATAAAITSTTDSICQSTSTVLNYVFYSDPTPGGTWSSSNPAAGSIDAVTGIYTASITGSGVTTISYTVGACSATTTLTVNPLPAPITGPTSVCRFLTVTLADATPGGTWSSTVPAAATVSSTGVVTGVGLGATNIYYTLPTGCEVSQFMSVSQPPLPITGPSQVCEGNAIVLTELVGGGTWSSSAPANASVTSGVVTGLLAATVNISYTMPSCPPATHVVTVNPLPATITGPTAVCTSMTTTLADATPGGSWSSSDPAVTVSSAGVVTSSTPGISAIIYYTLPTTCFVSDTVYVSVPPSPIISALDSICQGDTLTMYNGTTGGVWSSTNLAIAQVIDSTGFVTGISGGPVNISYTLPNGCYAVKPFIIRPPVTGVVNISYSPSGIVCDTTTVTFTATATNGGVPTYVWEKFMVPLTGLDSTGTYAYVPTHGDVITVIMMPHGVCALRDTVSDTIVMNVYPNNVVPSITIMTTGPDTIHYVGQVVTFFSVVTYGGTMQTYQWYKNGVAIPGATGSSYSTPVYASDTFWCEVVGNPPCSPTPVPPGISNHIIIHDFLAVGSVGNEANDLSLFPNPNTGSFTLTGKVATTTGNDVSYEVTNMLGQVMQKGSITPKNGEIRKTINLDNVAAGTYLLRINTETGSETFHFVIGR